jgi:hypothetical protein
MTKQRSMPVVRLRVAVAALLAVTVACGAAAAIEREPETAVRCICVDGVPLELREGSTVGPPGHGRLDWPGAGRVLRCRPTQLPVGAPGEEVEHLEAER